MYEDLKKRVYVYTKQKSRESVHLNIVHPSIVILLVIFRLFLEEERDSMRTKCLRNQTTIAEWRACLHNQKSGMIKLAYWLIKP